MELGEEKEGFRIKIDRRVKDAAAVKTPRSTVVLVFGSIRTD
jgi:hypothetical protein